MKMSSNKKTKVSESKFDQVISMAVPNFKEFNYCVEDFCGYYKETGKTCPFIEADNDTERQHVHLFNWDPQNCLWVCKWFIRPDLPNDAVRR